ncbi:hypothetical protein DsansV1_C15g0137811 [Dioscorea sansibarensis]
MIHELLLEVGIGTDNSEEAIRWDVVGSHVVEGLEAKDGNALAQLSLVGLCSYPIL